MKNMQPWTRRNFLRGLGTALALPALESVYPQKALAAGANSEYPPANSFHVCAERYAHA